MAEKLNKERFNWFKMFWDGFTSMTHLGKKLWIIVIIKLIIMFAIFKPFFFRDFLSSQYKTDKEKTGKVTEELIKRVK